MSTSNSSSSSGGPAAQADPDEQTPRLASAKKTYQTPNLVVYGKVSEITQFFDPYHHHHHRWMSDD